MISLVPMYIVSFNKDIYFFVYNIEIVEIEKFDLAPQSQKCFKLKIVKCIGKLLTSTFSSKIVFLMNLLNHTIIEFFMRYYLSSSATTVSSDNSLLTSKHASNKNIYHLLTHVFSCPFNGFNQLLFVL